MLFESMLLFFFSGFRVLILWFFPPPASALFFFLFQSPVLFIFHSFSVSSVLPPARSPCFVTCLFVFVSGSRPLVFCFVLPWVLSLVFLWFFSSSRRCVFSLFFPPFLPLFCSAFYRARELAPKTSPCYSPAFTGLLINPRAGSWAKEVVHDRIELLPFSLLNRLSPREMEGIMNSSSKRRRLCPWEWLFFTLVPELLAFIN